MSEQAEQLATQFQTANTAFMQELAALSGRQWRLVCPGEGWTVGVVAQHVASGTTTIMRHIRDLLADPQGPPETGATIQRRNAEDAARFADASQAEALAALQHTGAAAVTLVRGLTDAQFARRGPIVAGFREVDVAWLARFLVGHLEEHRVGIRAALSQAPEA